MFSVCLMQNVNGPCHIVAPIALAQTVIATFLPCVAASAEKIPGDEVVLLKVCAVHWFYDSISGLF